MKSPRKSDQSAMWRSLLLCGALLALLSPSALGAGHDGHDGHNQTALYFVQSGSHGKVVVVQGSPGDAEGLSLQVIIKGSSPHTVFFTDAPVYRAGRTSNEEFVRFLENGYNRTKPLNAALVFEVKGINAYHAARQADCRL